jgi:beta-glucosidase
VSSNGFREDLSAELENNAALTFTVKRDSEVNSPVFITMNCATIGDTQSSCQGSYNIQTQLTEVPLGVWHNMSISLRCFAEKGVQLNKVAVPFELSTSDAINLSINHIRLVPSNDESSAINCP